jgi:hypothetical protein
MRLITSFLAASCLLTASVFAAEPAVPSGEPLAQKGELIFSDDFERTDLGEWKSLIPTFTVKDGALKGEQTRDDHGAGR